MPTLINILNPKSKSEIVSGEIVSCIRDGRYKIKISGKEIEADCISGQSLQIGGRVAISKDSIGSYFILGQAQDFKNYIPKKVIIHV